MNADNNLYPDAHYKLNNPYKNDYFGEKWRGYWLHPAYHKDAVKDMVEKTYFRN